MTGPRLVGAATLAAGARVTAAGLAREALAPYYDMLPVEDAPLLAVLADEMDDVSTELGAGQVALVDDAVAGLLVAYPAAELRARQQASLFHLLRASPDESDDILAAAEKQALSVPPVSGDAYYLARFAVASALRGTGVADALLLALADAVPEAAPLALHVHRDNLRAIAFYRRLGFVRSDDGDLPFHAYLRS
ncbi:Acetyltransferase (GNAT) family protein [Sphingopyxis sp. YR583]|uniref:GNAT family N-acetyltransferase n=1 Tax=Sphingopyxis sp. YR583 TaxID=1881047 RepID=UPI0008A7A4CD|nr:GNAT family N-acetyltransferase [Sphingopyxis sp. YR583]SEH18299.1 Acetyltransferase (GNAT) family protein [Sphingopyxis sp. YR583]